MRIKNLLPVLCLWATAFPAFSHPTGTSKADLVIRPDTLEMWMDMNSEELMNVLRVTRQDTLTPADRDNLNDRIAYYLQTHLEISADGRPLDGMRVLSWTQDTLNGDRKMDSAALAAPTYLMKLAWPLRPGDRKLRIHPNLFVELEVQAICQTSVHWEGRLVKRRWLTLNSRMDLNLDPDSLRAAAAQADPSSANGSKQSGSVFGRFVWLGFQHIAGFKDGQPLGLDHILFVLGLFFFSVRLRPLFIQVTAFTLAHSITLGLSLLGIFSLSPRIVEPLIALSIAVVAAENIFFRKLRPSRWMIVFGFGLIHGLGFAGVLKELGLPEGQFLKTLIGFNLGVECGQVAVIAAAAALTAWMWKKPWYFRYVVIPVSAAIASMGLFWAVQRLVAPG